MARRRAAAALLLVAALGGCAITPATIGGGPPEPWATPLAAEVDELRSYVDARLESMTLEQKISSLIMVHVGGTEPGPMRRHIERHGLAGVILMGDNVRSVRQVADLTSKLSSDPGLPVLTAIDQEGGVVRRLPDTFPAALQLRGRRASATEAAFRARAELVAEAGVTINFGIVADITGDRGSFIFARTLGDTAKDAAPRVAAAVEGENGLVWSTLKHFPGHGSVSGDSHVSVPTTRMSLAEWRRTQAAPFQAGIDAGADFVMLGHLRYSAVDSRPASQSATWVGILREELGFDGVVVSDDMTMLERSGEAAYAKQTTNAVRAVGAGTDLLLYVGPVDVRKVVRAVAGAVRDGRIPEATVDAAARRLMELRRGMSEESGPFIHCGAACREFTE